MERRSGTSRLFLDGAVVKLVAPEKQHLGGPRLQSKLLNPCTAGSGCGDRAVGASMYI